MINDRVVFSTMRYVNFLMIAGCINSQAAVSTAHGNLFMGQTPPGRTPEIFAPKTISDAGYRLHGPVVFKPYSRKVYFSVIPPKIMSTTWEDSAWSETQQIPLQGRGAQSPAFSSDGIRLYYQAVIEGGFGSLDIWWVDDTENGWSEPINAGANVNNELLQSQPAVTADGTLYFTGTMEGVGLERGIFRSLLIDGEYAVSIPLEGIINSDYIDYCPWIAPDESYLIFASSRPKTEETLFLYISFRQDDDSWSIPVNIHPVIQFPDPARFPSVSPDGRYLFFVSGNRAYWVDITEVLELRSGT